MPGTCASATRRAELAKDRFDAFTEKYRDELEEYRNLEDKLWQDRLTLEAEDRDLAAHAAWSHMARMESVMADRDARRVRAEEKLEKANQRVEDLRDEIQSEIDAGEALMTTDRAESDRHLDRAAELDADLVQAEIARDEAESALERAEADLERAEAEYDQALDDWDKYSADHSPRDMKNFSRSKEQADRDGVNREVRDTAERLSTGFYSRMITEYDKRTQELANALRDVAQHCGPPADEDGEEEEDEEEEEEDEKDEALQRQQDADEAIAAEIDFLNQ